jgi:hypothetical protein
MKIMRTWAVQRVKQTSWPRGQSAPRPTRANTLSPVVAVVGIKGDKGDPGTPTDPGDLAGWYNLQKEL